METIDKSVHRHFSLDFQYSTDSSDITDSDFIIFNLFLQQTKPELKPTFSPSLLPILPNRSSPSPKYHHHQFQNHHREENSSPHQLLSSPLSAGGDEPRRRAPRALTGRYVKSGPGASPRTLAILRKKIQERLKLKELLGENSNLYFGALNKQKHVKAKVSTAASRF